MKISTSKICNRSHVKLLSILEHKSPNTAKKTLNSHDRNDFFFSTNLSLTLWKL
jgi:hypothetical protein